MKTLNTPKMQGLDNQQPLSLPDVPRAGSYLTARRQHIEHPLASSARSADDTEPLDLYPLSKS